MAKEEEGKVSAPVYVIRAGKVRGEGKYLQSSVVGPPWGDAQSAARFDSREEANDWIDSRCRVVRVAIVSNKTVTHGHHMASVAVDHGCIACGQAAPPIYCCIPCSDKEAYAAAAVARGLALEEAERIARDPNVPLTGIADAIAALRGVK